jgi:hypothetical protein
VPNLGRVKLVQIKLGDENRSARSKGHPLGTAFQRKQCPFFEVCCVLQIKTVQSQSAGCRVVKSDRSGIMSDDFAERLAGRVQNVRKTQLRNHGIVDVEQQLVVVALGFGVREQRLMLPPATRHSGTWVVVHLGGIS